jgi:hypothetical protein
MKNIKIFLASSETLKKFRNQLTIKIAAKNKIWNDKGYNLELVIWEDLSEQMQLTRSQDAYNSEIAKCDLFVLLASDKIGKYTKEEFDVAYNLFLNFGKPKVFVYLEKRDEIEQSLSDFKKDLNKLDYFPAYYSNFDELWNKINNEIDRFLHQIYRNTDTRTQNLNLPKQIGNIPVKPAVFMGREGKLTEIYKAFFEDGKPVVMLVGEGGIGKTTIASTYYHHYKDYYAHLIWSFAENGLEDAILSLATALQVKFDNTTTLQEQMEQMMQAINILSEPVLLIIDNVDDYENLMKNHSYLRKTPNIHILITSRLSGFEDFDKFDIKKLSPEIAKAFFKYHYKNFDPAEEQILEQVLKAIGYNTLVIELLAKNLQQTKIFGYNLQKLLTDLQTQGVLGITKSGKVAHTYHNLQPAKPQDIVEAMYRLSGLSGDELNLLTLFSVLPEITLPFNDLLEFTAYTEDNLMNILLDLANKAWLDIDNEQDGFKINTIVASIIRDKQQEHIYTACERMMERIIDDLDYETNTGTVKNYKQAQRMVAYASVFTGFIKERTYDLSLLYDRLGNFYENYGSLLTALKFFEEYNKLKKELYKSHPDNVGYKYGLAISYQFLGNTYTKLGNLEKSLDIFED